MKNCKATRLTDCKLKDSKTTKWSAKWLEEKAYQLIKLWFFMPFLLLFLYPLAGYYTETVFVHVVYAFGITGIILGFAYLKSLNKQYDKKVSLKTKLIDILPITLLAIFLVWALICSFASPDSLYLSFIGYILKREGFFVYIAYGGFLMSGIVAARNRENIIKLAKLFVNITCILSIFSMFYAFSQIKINGTYDAECFRGVYRNYNFYGYMLTMAILTWFFLILYKPNKGISYIYQLAKGIFLLNILIVNNTLGSYLAVFICMMFVLIWKFINKETDKKKVLFYIGIFILVSLLSMLYTDNVCNNFGELFGDLKTSEAYVSGNDGLDKFGDIGSGRGIRWKIAIQKAIKSPILGYGPDGMASQYVAEGIGECRPHNVFIHVLAYFGLPGFALYMATFIVGAKRLIKQRKTLDSVIKSAAFVVVGRMISEFFGNPFFAITPYFLIIFGVCCSGCLNGINQQKEDTYILENYST